MKLEGIDEVIKKNNLDSFQEQIRENKFDPQTPKVESNYLNLEMTNENPNLIIDLRKESDFEANFETNRYVGDGFNMQIKKHHDNGDYIKKLKLLKSERKRPFIDTSFNNDTMPKVNNQKLVFTPSNQVIGLLKYKPIDPSSIITKYKLKPSQNSKKFVYSHNSKHTSTNYTRR